MTIFNSYFDITRGYHWWLSSPNHRSAIGPQRLSADLAGRPRTHRWTWDSRQLPSSWGPVAPVGEWWFLLVSCDQREELETVGVWLQIHPYMNVNPLRCLWHVESCRMETTYPVNRWSVPIEEAMTCWIHVPHCLAFHQLALRQKMRWKGLRSLSRFQRDVPKLRKWSHIHDAFYCSIRCIIIIIT